MQNFPELTASYESYAQSPRAVMQSNDNLEATRHEESFSREF
jgi:hypothetical protein